VKQEWFSQGSGVIVTNSDKHLLIAHGVYETYMAKGLVTNEAFKLFCLRAFKHIDLSG